MSKHEKALGPERAGEPKGPHVLYPRFKSCSYAIIASILGLVALRSLLGFGSQRASCDGINDGYQCQPTISHYWGQYSPWYAVPSDIFADVPNDCHITFAQVLSRHGSRYPTTFKARKYNATVQMIKDQVNSFAGDYAFLADYVYGLGTDQLTAFGEREMLNSGIKYYNRYRELAKDHVPFVRASGQSRVVESARSFAHGYHLARLADKTSTAPDPYPYPILEIPETDGSNNTLHAGLCAGFENGPISQIGPNAQRTWADIFAAPITQRLNANLLGVDLNSNETVYLMDLCPFSTVASRTGEISPFCKLFTEKEWHHYDYYQSLGKYYGRGNGNPLGPTQGTGFVNELLARLLNEAVNDHTSVNHTLDDSQSTFPTGKHQALYADFSHDNDITGILSVLGLYNATSPLSNITIETTKQTNGYSASWTVPFASRAYFEKMSCSNEAEELVRVLVNDRVLPLETCGGDALGRCKLSKFVNSLTFAAGGGKWQQCFE